MQSVQLELLRNGPAHNQLLSPLVEYMALCGTHPATPVRFPHEHEQLRRHLMGLRYQIWEPLAGNEAQKMRARSARLAHVETIREMTTQFLSSIGPLSAEISTIGNEWLHLRLVITPMELSMLPFELAHTPEGCPGQDLPFLLNPKSRVCLTREVRQVGPSDFRWPTVPRVLLAAASPPGFAPVPLEAHFQALRQALDLWRLPETESADTGLDDLLTVLPHASLTEILDRCQQKHYTHVHILAHGVSSPLGDEKPAGVVFFSRDGKGHEVVDGVRLANALGCPCAGPGSSFPAVVTVASCDSGDTSDLLVPGGSLAHALHRSGVPLVLASQYPLSMAGSVIVAKEFYPRVLAGEDPRMATYCVRKQLYVANPEYHDWASLVVYARLPDDLDEQLEGVRLRQAFRRMHSAHAVTQHEQPIDTRQLTAFQNLKTLWETTDYQDPRLRCEHLALLGGGEKKLAEQAWHAELYQSAMRAHLPEGVDPKHGLRQARDWYRMAMKENPLYHWATVQFLSLTAVLDGSLADHHNLLTIATYAAEEEREACETMRRKIWALGSLAELALLRPLATSEPIPPQWQEAGEESSRTLKELRQLTRPSSTQLSSTVRQLERYVTWWTRDNGYQAPHELELAAGKALDLAFDRIQE